MCVHMHACVYAFVCVYVFCVCLCVYMCYVCMYIYTTYMGDIIYTVCMIIYFIDPISVIMLLTLVQTAHDYLSSQDTILPVMFAYACELLFTTCELLFTTCDN